MASVKAKVNLYCLTCEAQIGIFDNEWIRLTSSYARSKEDGLHFGTDLGNKAQVVPSGVAQKAAAGCTMVEVFCNTCHNIVGQNCKKAPTKDKVCLVGKYFYKLSKVFLKDTQAFHLVDPIFGFAGDLFQMKPPRSNRLSSERLSETPSAKLDQPLRSSQSNSGKMISSPTEARTRNSDFTWPASARPASHHSGVAGNEFNTTGSSDNPSRALESVYMRNRIHPQQQEAVANFDGTTQFDGANSAARHMSLQPPSQDYVIQYVPRHIYEDQSVFHSAVHSRAASTQPTRSSDAQMDLTQPSALMRLQSIPADAVMYTHSPKTVFHNDGRVHSLGYQSPDANLIRTTASRSKDGNLTINSTLPQSEHPDTFGAHGSGTERRADQNHIRLGLLGEQEDRLDKLNDKLDSVQAEMRYLRNILEDLRKDRNGSDTEIDSASKLICEPDNVAASTEVSRQHQLTIEALQAENDDLRVKLDGIAQVIGVVTTSATMCEAQQIIRTSLETPVSLGKRKRAEKYGPNKRSSLQHEVVFANEVARPAESTTVANSVDQPELNETECQGSFRPTADTARHHSAARSTNVEDQWPHDSSRAQSEILTVSESEAALIVAGGNDDIGTGSDSFDGEFLDQYCDESDRTMGDNTERLLRKTAERENGQVPFEKTTAANGSYDDNEDACNPADKVLTENRQSYGKPIDFSDEESATSRNALVPEKSVGAR